MANPRHTGRQVWNRQRTDRDLADPGNVALGHKSIQRWNLPGLAAPCRRRYLLAGLLVCGGCGRRMESAWSNGKREAEVAEIPGIPDGYRQGALMPTAYSTGGDVQAGPADRQGMSRM